MKYLEFGALKLPLHCITGLSYAINGNIVERSNLSCSCRGMQPLELQLQATITESHALLLNTDLYTMYSEIEAFRPSKRPPFNIIIDDSILLPFMKFALVAANYTVQSDRGGKLSQIDVAWTLIGTQVQKIEDSNNIASHDTGADIPKISIYCKGKQVLCEKDINISGVNLSPVAGNLELILSDSYTQIDDNSWMKTPTTAQDTRVDIEGFGSYYPTNIHFSDGNILNIELTKFNREWFKRITQTFFDTTAYDVLNFLGGKTKTNLALKFRNFKIDYFALNDTPFNTLSQFAECTGLLIAMRNDELILYEVPEKLVNADLTLNYYADTDIMSSPYTRVVCGDGVDSHTAGDDTGATYTMQLIYRTKENIAKRLLKYISFQENVITLTIPYTPKIQRGTILNLEYQGKEIVCACTEFSTDFLSNQMQLELHYITR